MMSKIPIIAQEMTVEMRQNPMFPIPLVRILPKTPQIIAFPIKITQEMRVEMGPEQIYLIPLIIVLSKILRITAIRIRIILRMLPETTLKTIAGAKIILETVIQAEISLGIIVL